MDLTNLDKILEKEPAFRKSQAKKAIFQEFVENWQEAKTLPLNLRCILDKECPLKINVQAIISQDEKTVKALITLKDNLKIETVLMRHNNGRNTVCVSSQVGCALGCSFCATGKLGFKRNLTSMEIVEQVLFFARYLKSKNSKITNVVFMGMGEPFLNYDNVLDAIKILNDKDGFGLGSRHFSISTVGIVDGIRKLAGEKLQVNLAISLHAPNDKLRSEIMSVNKKYPLKDVLEEVDLYIRETRRKVMFEYIMIKDINDSNEYAKALAVIMKKPLYFVNLISYNFTRQSFGDGGPTVLFQPSSNERTKSFRQILEDKGVGVTQRYKFGSGIKAACGQLAGKSVTLG